MFGEEIQHLQALLYRIVTLQVNSPDKREYQQQAYESVVGVIAALENLKTPIPSLQAPDEPVADLYEAITQEERFKEWFQ
jgi:hypothetical protein